MHAVVNRSTVVRKEQALSSPISVVGFRREVRPGVMSNDCTTRRMQVKWSRIKKRQVQLSLNDALQKNTQFEQMIIPPHG